MNSLKQMLSEWSDPHGARTVNDAEELIDELINSLPRWIPVSERLPVKGKPTAYAVLLNHKFLDVFKFSNGRFPTDLITHWLDNIPDAPTEGE